MCLPAIFPAEMDADLRRFAEADEAEARRAFDRLTPGARRYLRGCLRGAAAEDCEDIVQDTLAAVWRYRARFTSRGAAAWLGLLRVTVRQRLVDRHRTPAETTLDEAALAELAHVEGAENDTLAAVLLHAEAEQVERAANLAWLGLDPALSCREHRRRLLAAQTFFLDGAKWDQVARLLRLAPPETARRVLDEWFAEPALHRHLAWSQLYLSGRVVGERLLAASPELDRAEADAVRWRYQHGMLVDQILARRDCPLDRPALEALFARMTPRLPFMSIMSDLLTALSGVPGAPASLADTGLWRRLAFDYGHREGLPQRDILERLGPAAAQVGYALTPAALNGWLSGGRLLRRLAVTLARSAP